MPPDTPHRRRPSARRLMQRLERLLARQVAALDPAPPRRTLPDGRPFPRRAR